MALDRNQLVNRINRALDLPMAFLSLVMLGLVLTDLLVEVPPEVGYWLNHLNWAIWGAFAAEFVFKLVVATDKRQYVRTHWFDAVVVIVPMFRVVRALRILRVTRAFPLFRLAAFMGMGLRGTRRFFGHYRLGYLLTLSCVVTVAGAAGVFLLERHVPDTRFVTFGDSLWWSAALMTTIGSDLNPQTGFGRLLALVMMFYAMIVFVYVISALSNELLRSGGPKVPSTEQGLAEMDGEQADATGA
ncbi:MAG: ion transporter [Candidatus Sericytochromatia bacterium]